MKLDIVAYKGEAGKPAVVFIHGLGMDKDIWINPSESRILGGMFPLKVLLKKYPPEDGAIRTLFDILRRKGYTVVTWSQKRPAGTIDPAELELQEVIRIVRGMDHGPVILLGHSRGGLIARRYLAAAEKPVPVQALITLATPHRGTTVAGFAKYVAPLAAWLAPVIPKGEKGTLRFALRRVFEFLRSRALREILPESAFFRSLRDRPMEGVYYASVGGTSPSLFTLSGVAVPDIFEKIIPAGLFPEEMKRGKGDGLVSAESSRLPWCHEHHLFDLNHAEILFDDKVKEKVVTILERFD